MRLKLGACLLSAGLLVASITSPAFADCNPPPGLSIDQFYQICGGDLQQAYAAGMGQGQPFDFFVRWIYSGYVAGPQMPMQQSQQPGLIQNCPLGQVQCFSHYLRRCEIRGAVTMWITGAERC